MTNHAEATQLKDSEILSRQTIELDEFQIQLLKEAENNLKKFEKEFLDKKYLVDLSAGDVSVLKNFVLSDAKWKFMESLGIGEVSKHLSNSIDKKGKVFINAIAIEAIHYYLSKVEGTGNKVDSSAISTVDTYLRLLKAINGVKNAINIDNEKRKELEYIVTCRSEGLDPNDPEIKD